MRLHVPMSKDISWFVLLDAGGFDLLESPLREIHIACSEIAVHVDMFQAESGRQSAYFGVVARSSIIDNLYFPVIFCVPDCRVAIA